MHNSRRHKMYGNIRPFVSFVLSLQYKGKLLKFV